MSLPCNKVARNAQLAACLLGAVLMHRAEAASVLNVCVDQANPTSAMDARVARAAAKTQGYAVKLVPFVGIGKGGDGFPLGRFARLAQSECQLVMGFPVDLSTPNLPPDVEATSAYASTGFVLVRRGASKTVSLSELPQGSEVGIAQLEEEYKLTCRNLQAIQKSAPQRSQRALPNSKPLSVRPRWASVPLAPSKAATPAAHLVSDAV